MNEKPPRSGATRLIAVLGILLIALVIFWAGTMVGYRRAQFSYRWDSHYADMFGGPNSPFSMRAGPDGIVSSNGAVGRVIAVNLPSVAVQNGSEAEKIVLVGPATAVRRLRATATTSDIRTGDVIVAIGSPDEDGRIVATFIRILPPMGSTTDVMYSTGSSPRR